MSEGDDAPAGPVAASPRVIHGRVGLAAFGALFADGFRELRSDPQLRASFVRWAGFGLLFTVGFSVGVTILVSPLTAVAAGLGAVAWWVVAGSMLVGGVPMLETPDGVRIHYYGWPNGLSAVRAWSCLPMLLTAALPLPGQTSLAVWCAVGGPVAMLDFVDGWIARRFGPLTRLGQAIDPAGDAVFFSCAALGDVFVGIFPAWLAVLIVIRYLSPLVGTPIVFLARRRPELVHTEWGRRNTLIVGVALFVCMLTRLLGGNVEIPALILGLPLLVTTVLHFVTLTRITLAAPLVMPSLRERIEARVAARERRGPRG